MNVVLLNNCFLFVFIRTKDHADISSYNMLGRKEVNVLFNDALNTFYLRLYGVTHMVKDHSERKPPAAT